MYFWRDSSFKGLKELAESSDVKSKFTLYSLYCEQRERGLRKVSLETINRFILDANSWPVAKKFEFVAWILSLRDERPELCDLIPTPLYKGFIGPVLTEWMKQEPSNPEPLRLSNTYETLRKALAIDSKDEKAAELFARKVVQQLSMSAHELPDFGYLGEASSDLALVQECIAVLHQLGSSKLEPLQSTLNQLQDLLNSWSDYSVSRVQMPFKDWATRNHRVSKLV